MKLHGKIYIADGSFFNGIRVKDMGQEELAKVKAIFLAKGATEVIIDSNIDDK